MQAENIENSKQNLWGDLLVLIKFKLNLFVLLTAFLGFFLASKGGGFSWIALGHTLLGTALLAFGSAVANQLLEIHLDRKMQRTAERPLPQSRISVMSAFCLAWFLNAFGLVHLLQMVGLEAALLGATTALIYIFIYTPLKTVTSFNTVIGALTGAFPPMIGWIGGGGNLGDLGAIYLGGALFFWQFPHFVAINWICRKEYRVAGYKMWANHDESGKQTARFVLVLSLLLAGFSFCPLIAGWTSIQFIWTLGVSSSILLFSSGLFLKAPSRQSARKYFLSTLLYLFTLCLGLAITWKA